MDQSITPDLNKDLGGNYKIKRKRVWSRRFLYLKAGTLCYYKSPTSIEPRFKIQLSGCCISKDTNSLVLDILKNNQLILKIQFNTLGELGIWQASLTKLAKEIFESNIENSCAYSSYLNAFEKENIQLLDQIPKSSLLPVIDRKIQEIINIKYNTSTNCGCCIFYHNDHETNKVSCFSHTSLLYLLLLFFICKLIKSYFGTSSSILALSTAIVYFSITSKPISKASSLQKFTFKTTTTINAGIGEIVSGLFDNSSRPQWEPYLSLVLESFSLHFSYKLNGISQSQFISRHFFHIKNFYYVVEKTQDDEIKNLFKLEIQSQDNQSMTLVTHYGNYSKILNPLIGNPDFLSFFKLYIETSNLYSTQISENQGIIESDDEDQEGSSSILDINSPEEYYNETNRILNDSKALLAEQNGWEELKIQSHYVNAYRRKAAGGLYIIKSEGELKGTPQDIVECLKDLSRKSYYDAMFESGYVVKLINEDMGISYQRFKRIGPVNGRDFCLLQRKICIDDGTIAAVALSVQHPECPETNYVRGHIYFATHFLVPVGNDKTKMIYLLHMDVRGSIPKFVVNSTQSDQAMFVENLRVYLK